MGAEPEITEWAADSSVVFAVRLNVFEIALTLVPGPLSTASAAVTVRLLMCFRRLFTPGFLSTMDGASDPFVRQWVLCTVNRRFDAMALPNLGDKLDGEPIEERAALEYT